MRFFIYLARHFVIYCLMDIFPGKTDRLLSETQSAIQDIKVWEKLNGFRYLTLNGVHQGGHLPGSPEKLVLPYFRCMASALAFLEAPRNYLFIGLGMGAMPSYFRFVQPDAEIDAVEIDPAVAVAAKEWFGLKEDGRLRVTAGDGREYVRKTGNRYDAVFIDAYRDLSVPSHLTTVEFMHEVKAILKPGGVAVSNLWGSVVNPLFDPCVRTLQVSFPALYQFKSYTYNYVFVCDTKEGEIMPGELLSRARAVMSKSTMTLGFDLVGLIRRNYTSVTWQEFPGKPLHD